MLASEKADLISPFTNLTLQNFGLFKVNIKFIVQFFFHVNLLIWFIKDSHYDSIIICLYFKHTVLRMANIIRSDGLT